MNYLVLGLGRSGVGATKLLEQHEENIFVFDDNKKNMKEMQNAKIFSKKVVFLRKIDAKTLKNIDFIVISPGIDAKKYEKKFQKTNTKIIGELELAFRFCDFPVLAVTGTNGKTTTVSLLYHIIKKGVPQSVLVGNVGSSFCDVLSQNKKINIAICEVSSFQLEHIEQMKPTMVGFLNIADDHLDRYKTFDDYFKAKQNIFKNFSTNDIAVFNFDDQKLLEFSKTLNSQKYYFSLNKLPSNLFGAYVYNKELVFKFLDREFKINLDEIKLLGKHNLYNIMCAGIMAFLSGVNYDVVCDCIKTFSSPQHRVEFVKKIDGVSFYDDSKGTNIHSSLSAISCFPNQKILLILGGKDKGENYDKLFVGLTKNVTRIFVYGKAARKICKAAKKNNFENIKKVKTIKDVFNFLNTKDMLEDVVLLSPACSSFDQFSSFEERGNYFKSLVEGLINEK